MEAFQSYLITSFNIPLIHNMDRNFQLCMSAMSQQAGSGVIFETCSAEKAVQRWRVEGKFVILDVFNADEVRTLKWYICFCLLIIRYVLLKILHLDIGSTGDDLVVTDLGLRGWTITISSGYRADWLGLRKAYRGDSFVTRSYWFVYHVSVLP